MKNYLWEIIVIPNNTKIGFKQAINRNLNQLYVYHIGTVKEIQTYCKQNYKNYNWFIKPVEEINVL